MRQVIAYKRVENNGKLNWNRQPQNSTLSRGRLEVPTVKLLLGKDECSLIGGGCLRELVARGGTNVLFYCQALFIWSAAALEEFGRSVSRVSDIMNYYTDINKFFDPKMSNCF